MHVHMLIFTDFLIIPISQTGSAKGKPLGALYYHMLRNSKATSSHQPLPKLLLPLLYFLPWKESQPNPNREEGRYTQKGHCLHKDTRIGIARYKKA